MKKFTVAIIGAGSRGVYTYGSFMAECSDRYRIAAICDRDADKLDRAKKVLKTGEIPCFTDEDAFFEKKRADLLVIATPDKDHVRQALKAMPLGYSILLEKPISADYEECLQLMNAQKKYGNFIMVCHVLRYTASVRKIREVIDSGVLGKIISVDHLERVAYWHFAHSYVRGNWHNEKQSAPSILAKCCHDLDLMQYYAKSKCVAISSVGNLEWFKAENKPDGASERCLDCKYAESCEYSAKRIYLHWAEKENFRDLWPYNTITAEPLSGESILKALRETDYGKCVYGCDNDVADNQHIVMEFENGIKVYLTMMAFTYDGGRRTSIYGSKGELFFDESKNTLKIALFNDRITEYKLTDLEADMRGHGGGDNNMIRTLYDILIGREKNVQTDLASSVESHKLAHFAEISRKNGGIVIDLRKD